MWPSRCSTGSLASAAGSLAPFTTTEFQILVNRR